MADGDQTQTADPVGGPDPQHPVAGAIHVAGGAGPNSWIDPTETYWWDGHQWQTINWNQAVQVHATHQAPAWGILADVWTRMFHAAWQGVTQAAMTPARRVEMAGAIADSAMHFFHQHGLAVAATIDTLSQHARATFEIWAVQSWLDSYVEALSSHASSVGSDPSAPARQAATDTDAMLQSQADAGAFQTYSQHLHY